MQKNIERIAEHFGTKTQLAKCQEELSELIIAISKLNTCKAEDNVMVGIIEEIADVEIMVEQIKYLLNEEMKKQNSNMNIYNLVDFQRAFKISRTIRRYGINEQER